MAGCLQLFSLYVVSAFSGSSQGRFVSPTGVWDYSVAAVSIAVIVVAAYFCIKCLLLPAEDEDTHIKRRILNDNNLTDEEGVREREVRESSRHISGR
jgi:hypothetical protein